MSNNALASDRDELARLIDPFSQGAASNDAGEAADRILAAGWVRLPPEGSPEWDAMVERIALACGHPRPGHNLIAERAIIRALRGAQP
jgi:hypothetical protein